MPYIGENSIMQNTSTPNDITPLLHLSCPLIFHPQPFANIFQNEYCLFHRDWIWGFAWNHLSTFSRPRVRKDKMRCECAEMLGPRFLPSSCPLTLPRYPNCRALKLLFPPVCFLPSYFTLPCHIWNSQETHIAFYMGLSFWTYFALRSRAASVWCFWGQGVLSWGAMSP